MATVIVTSFGGGGTEISLHNLEREEFEKFLPLLDLPPKRVSDVYIGYVTVCETLKLVVVLSSVAEIEFPVPAVSEAQRKVILDAEFIASFPAEEEVNP